MWFNGPVEPGLYVLVDVKTDYDIITVMLEHPNVSADVIAEFSVDTLLVVLGPTADPAPGDTTIVQYILCMVTQNSQHYIGWIFTHKNERLVSVDDTLVDRRVGSKKLNHRIDDCPYFFIPKKERC